MAISLRHQARIMAMQALYEWDLTQHDLFQALERQVALRRDSARVTEFARLLLRVIAEHRDEIDARLAVVAAERPLEQMARVEKAILRLAISELLFDNGVPARAAINEAVELAKTYGGENSSRFVNGVLGTLYQQHQAHRDLEPTPEREEHSNGHQPALGSPEAGHR